MSLSFESLTLIGEIKRQLGYSYPYKAGSATVHTPGLSKIGHTKTSWYDWCC